VVLETTRIVYCVKTFFTKPTIRSLLLTTSYYYSINNNNKKYFVEKKKKIITMPIVNVPQSTVYSIIYIYKIGRRRK